MKGDVGILGAYFNDDGVNLMHDDFFLPMARETEAILRLARREAPDMAVSLHSHEHAPVVLQASYVPAFMKERIQALSAKLKARHDQEGLPVRQRRGAPDRRRSSRAPQQLQPHQRPASRLGCHGVHVRVQPRQPQRAEPDRPSSLTRRSSTSSSSSTRRCWATRWRTDCSGESAGKEWSDHERRSVPKVLLSDRRCVRGVASGREVRTARLERRPRALTPRSSASASAREPTRRRCASSGRSASSYVLMGGPPIPWQEPDLRAIMDRFRAGGLAVANMMIGGFPKTLYGRPGRDEEIDKVIQSIRAAGKVGLPVIEYNFYAHRLTEGYYEELGRAGAGMTAYDYNKLEGPAAAAGHGHPHARRDVEQHHLLPQGRRAGGREGRCPAGAAPQRPSRCPSAADPSRSWPPSTGWKKLIEIVPSPSNGITYDCGVTREMGEDPVAVCRYFGERDRINHVHYRNVVVRKPYVEYTEVFPDEGQVDMFAVMKELVRQKYPRALYPEHPRALDADRELPGFKPYYPGEGSTRGSSTTWPTRKRCFRPRCQGEAPEPPAQAWSRPAGTPGSGCSGSGSPPPRIPGRGIPSVASIG